MMKHYLMNYKDFADAIISTAYESISLENIKQDQPIIIMTPLGDFNVYGVFITSDGKIVIVTEGVDEEWVSKLNSRLPMILDTKDGDRELWLNDAF